MQNRKISTVAQEFVHDAEQLKEGKDTALVHTAVKEIREGCMRPATAACAQLLRHDFCLAAVP